MIQLLSLFTKIKEDFYKNHLSKDEKKDEYNLIFSPFSTGFNYDDFLFLDTNNAAEDAHKYLDELYEFSQIANTLPTQAKYWTISGEQHDYLYNPFKTILRNLRLLDPESLTIDMLYNHPIFSKALDAVRESEKETYRAFFRLRKKIDNEITNLEANKAKNNETAIEVEIKMKKDNLNTLEKEWREKGDKEKIEKSILQVVKDEHARFLKRLTQAKGKMDSLKREHVSSGATFYLTSCMPNNLYKGDELSWKKINLDQQEVKKISKKIDKEEFKSIFGQSDLSELEVEAINFELLFVNVTRAWFNQDILMSPFWDLNLLNPEEMEIPKITKNLIFIRNIDIKLPKSSAKNKEIIKNSKEKSLGPFVIDKQLMAKSHKIQLKSVNKALKIKRNTVLNVSSKLNEKRNKKRENIKTLINRKQNQFIKLAPRLRKKVQLKAKLAKPQVIATEKAKPIVRDHRKKTRKREETTTQESFQLIGVVAQNISEFPNPIKGADYL